ncbi:CRISPR-associated protein GSU0053/csb1, Dpsyc system [Azospirillum lipoferum]|nr:CRISPR-associated protein GSU0053/csb1, Dpsyc system [Azospirillum lipoferum]
MNIATLTRMVAGNAALRRRQTLQPVGGQGDKIFPPTYPGEGRNAQPTHVYEVRRLNGEDVACVLVDSPQSQANRLEESLLAAHRSGDAPVPHVVVDFNGFDLAGLSEVTSLDAPHRVYDAVLRDSLLDGKPFMNSPVGERLAKAKPEDASALLETSPSALLFGAWHSTGEGGGLGAKFARCLVSEIVAVRVPVEPVENRRTGEVELRTAGRRHRLCRPFDQPDPLPLHPRRLRTTARERPTADADDLSRTARRTPPRLRRRTPTQPGHAGEAAGE